MARMAICIVFAAILSGWAPATASHRLTAQEANRLVTNIPDALTVKRRGGCPTPDYAELGPDLALVQLRNTCPRSGSGLIGNYVVDLRSGKIWSDIDRKNP
jgi:hypothetical protein